MPTYLSAIFSLLTIIVPLLINLTDLKFRKEADFVFQAHPINTKVAVLSLLAFVLAFGIELTFHTCHISPTCAALLRTTMVFFGSFSLASLASLLFPGAVWPFLLVIYAFLALSNMQNLVRKWCHWVHHRLIYNLETVLTGFGQFHTWGLDSNGESNSIRKRRKQSTFSLEPMEPVCSLILEGGASNVT